MSELESGLVDVLRPLVESSETKVQAVLASQKGLEKELQRLSQELARFVTAADGPSLEHYVSKLTDTRQRLTSAEALILASQKRLFDMKVAYEKKKGV
mmetsp:Transcript_21543/g.55945  ORF Transcript_21543/g.55945 Transcript_21543/m.55945 type:complete len:98 (+) Transcript_21543:320-613(+)|eukprot:CAMPEP_0113893382 /NCGR_PEP_ID=MMETSP0780_2-20120614/16049_1 /TAXON_ID=652834 /ORGANISM="Palpitomonas bilix" /LENGTH=97 /DNA_ID=CAMNT_0000883641 /DNA_START=290 /DNA_END=583 /DNA_ORIENTATION=- /assembly_acc=CAM_ASM_000599